MARRRIELDDGNLAAVRGGIVDGGHQEAKCGVIEEAADLDHS